MTWFLEATLSNALIATAMGVVVVAIGRFWRHRPAVLHAMWLLVLIKLITPPLAPVPIHVGWETRGAFLLATQGSAGEVSSALPMDAVAEGWTSSPPAASDAFRHEMEPQIRTRWNFQTLALGCWLMGTVLWTLVAAARIVGFSRLLQAARPCGPELATLADRVAARLGMANAPAVEVVDAQISPLVWHAGRRPRIVLPGDLVSQWTDERLELVLAHEMAHVKRRDHLIRWFTLLALAAFWWHPIAWLAVRRLRMAEEQCCDAMVVAATPGRALAYAETLLVTLDLLVARRLPPALTSGIDSGGSLKRRCEMILNDRTTFRIGRVGGLLLLLVAISILPLAARVRAEDESEPENAAARRPDVEQDAPESAGRTLDIGWHADVRKSSDCIQCHDFSLPAHHEHVVGKALHDFDHQLGQFELLLRKRVEYFRSKKRGARDLERMEKLLDSMNRMLELERATQGLKNLGFDDALIEALIQDRARAKSAEEALKKILRLTNEGQAEPETDETSLLDLRYTSGLRMPAHPMLAQERARIDRYLQNAEGHAEAETDDAGQE